MILTPTPNSLKARITFATLVIVISSIWALAYYISEMLRLDMQHLLGEQQFSTVSLVASDVNQELTDRMVALRLVAATIDPDLINQPVGLQRVLENRPILALLFNGGYFVVGLDGTAMASVPVAVGRAGINYMDREYVAVALEKARPVIGDPYVGKARKVPAISLSTPILDAQGKVVGALVGVTDLSQPNFLRHRSDSRYGESGGYLFVDKRHRQIITASDAERSLEYLPAPGVNPVLDRFIGGHEGYEVFVNSKGIELIAAVKGVTAADWYVAAVLPTSEAFLPLYNLQGRMILATVFVTLLLGVMTWWLMRRQLAPMLSAVQSLAAMSDGTQPMQLLPVIRRDEVGLLIDGFNRLLISLRSSESALREGHETLRSILATTLDGYWQTDVHGHILDVNQVYAEQCGYQAIGPADGWRCRRQQCPG